MTYQTDPKFAICMRQKYPSSFNLLNFLSLFSSTIEAALFSFFFLSHSFLSQSFSCFNQRNKNNTTTATTRFVTPTTRSVSLPLSAISDSLSRLGHGRTLELHHHFWQWCSPAPPPPLVTVGLPFLSMPLFLLSFLCFWLYLGCFGEWVQFGM